MRRSATARSSPRSSSIRVTSIARCGSWDRTARPDYFTPDGKSLRKAFLKAPLEFTRVSSVFNPARRHPVLNTIRAHRGVDYAAPSGTPIRAAGDGRVQFRGQKGGFGNVLEIAHANRVVTVYGHLSRFAKGLNAGDKVRQGEVVAYVGMTGLATGPHLHFEYRVGGEWKNPQTILKTAQAAAPIEATQREAFARETQPLLAMLDGAPAPAPAVTVPALAAPGAPVPLVAHVALTLEWQPFSEKKR